MTRELYCDHPYKDVVYELTTDWDGTLRGECTLCGHVWWESAKEHRRRQSERAEGKSE